MLHRCRPAGYRLVAAVVTVAAGLTLLGAPAGAVPDLSTPGDPAQERATPANCSTDMLGVTGANRLVHRRLTRGVPDRPDNVAPRRLPFTPTSLAYGSTDHDGSDIVYDLLALNSDRTLRMLTVRSDVPSTELSWTSRPLANRNFRHRLLAGSKLYYFAVDPRGTLRRWYLLRNADGKQYLGRSQVVRRGMGNLKTLSYYHSFNLRGHHTAILFATTRSGGLMQIRVGDRDPARKDDPVGKVRVVQLRKRGFGNYDLASLSTCNRRYEDPALTYIDRSANVARLYSLGNGVWKPEATRLVNRGQVARDLNWRIRAAI